MTISKVLLTDFIAKAISNGLDLTGCTIECSKSSYKFVRMNVEGKVEILYGRDLQEESTLVPHIRVYSVSLARPIKMKQSRLNHPITIHCKNQARR